MVCHISQCYKRVPHYFALFWRMYYDMFEGAEKHICLCILERKQDHHASEFYVFTFVLLFSHFVLPCLQRCKYNHQSLFLSILSTPVKHCNHKTNWIPCYLTALPNCVVACSSRHQLRFCQVVHKIQQSGYLLVIVLKIFLTANL
jgi:hypothetical protein